jgi:nucleoside-diphosphate-sugar epimerase
MDPDEARHLLPMGYARAKYICESLCQTHAENSPSPVSVLRVGQICGPVSGSHRLWPEAEWFPSLVISSKFLGVVPASLGRMEINWVPVDELAKIVDEISRNVTADKRFMLYNVVNPQISSWEDLLPALGKVSQSGLTRLPPRNWIAKVAGSGGVGKDSVAPGGAGTHLIHQNPALKLVDFYKESLVSDAAGTGDIEVKNLLASSETARSLRAIQRSDMASWVEAWGL